MPRIVRTTVSCVDVDDAKAEGMLAGRPRTGDLCDSPALGVAALLSGPMPSRRRTTRAWTRAQPAGGAEAVVVLTEWPEFRSLDWPRLGTEVVTRLVVDTRNLLDPDVLRRAGFTWVGVGRRQLARS